MPDLAPYAIVPMLDRSLLIVTPKTPYLAWGRKVAQGGDRPASPKAEPKAFLLPDNIVDERDANEWLQAHCDTIFAQLLTSWHRDRATWPQPLKNFSLFAGWFDIRYIDVVFDVDGEME